jgi:hypothetical protein
MLGLMFSIEAWDQLLEYWRSMCILFLCQKFRNEIKAALESIQTFATIEQVIADTIEATNTIIEQRKQESQLKKAPQFIEEVHIFKNSINYWKKRLKSFNYCRNLMNSCLQIFIILLKWQKLSH